MNEILQQRLEKAARHYLLHEHKSPLNEILHQCDLKTEMQYHRDIESAYIEGVTFALQNQWISVEEALPNDDENVIVTSERGDIERMRYHNNSFYHTLGREIIRDGEKITHWMPIPSLKEGEK